MNPLSPDRWRDVQALLDGALDLAARERAEFLRRACRDDPDLRVQVEELLAADEAAGSWLDAPAAECLKTLVAELAAESAQAAVGWSAGQQFGPWRVVRELGRGGMGVVLLAERSSSDFAQRVALKLVKRGLDTDEILRRFAQERRILARLEHPNIARLVDGGLSHDGRPYLAMEYVEGDPLLLACDARKLRVEQRLQLFLQVCAALDHAHRNLVVHRDLKPSNILLTATGLIKVLDFGVAKLLADEGPDALTRPGARALTPEYAAPEQLLGEPVTTAADVYGLGAVLMELLSGTRPPPALEAPEGGSRPSLMAQRGTPEAAAARGLSRARLARRLRGDLDTIVLEALDPEPARRYPSAAALADDLHGHLSGRAIHARGDSAVYRAGRFARRNWLPLGAAGLVAASLAVGLVVARAQARRAEVEAAKAGEVKSFVLDLFKVSDPERADGAARLSAEELLERGAHRVDQDLAAQPALQAEMLAVLGEVFTNLGRYERGRELLERALALRRALPDAPRQETIETLVSLAQACRLADRLEQAENSAREALERSLAFHGEQHLENAAVRVELALTLADRGRYAEAERQFQAALETRRRLLGDGDRLVGETLAALARLLHQAGELQRSEESFRAALVVLRASAHGHDIAVADGLFGLAALLRDRGALEEAESLAREALAIQTRVLGEAHPVVADTLHDLATVLRRRGRPDEARVMYRRAISIYRQALGRHSYLATALFDLARLELTRGATGEADALLDEALSIYREKLGPRHSYVGMALATRAAIRERMGRPAEAERLYASALEIYGETMPRDHPYVAQAEFDLGELLLARRRWSQAEPLLRHVAKSWTQSLGPDDPHTGQAREALDRCLRALAHPADTRAIH